METTKTEYKLNGKSYTRVTTILNLLDKSNALIPWALNCMEQYISENLSQNEPIKETISRAKKEYREISKKAKDIGSEIHDKIKEYIQHGKDACGEMRPEVENGFLAFLEWEAENSVKWLGSEIFVYSDVLGVAGTLDAPCEIRGKRYIIDFKSAKAIYDEYLLQLCAYRFLYSDVEKIDNLGILRLDKETGKPEFFDITEKYGLEKIEMLTEAFKLLANFHKLYKAGKSKRKLKGA